MSLEDLGFKRLISRPSSLVGAVSASPSGWVWGGLGAALAGVLGAAVYYRKTTPEYEATLDRVAKLLKKPRAVIETDASPELLRLAKKGVTAEAIAFGIRANTLPEEMGRTVDDVLALDKAICKAPERERQRLAIANAIDKNMIGPSEMLFFGWDPNNPLAPQYPFLDTRDAARVAARGVSPKKLFEPVPWQVVEETAARRDGDGKGLTRTRPRDVYRRPVKTVAPLGALQNRRHGGDDEDENPEDPPRAEIDALPPEERAAARAQIRARRDAMRKEQQNRWRRENKIVAYDTPRLYADANRIRERYIERECRPLVTQAWQSLGVDDRLILALERQGIRIGTKPAGFVQPPDGARHADRWFPTLAEAMDWAEKKKVRNSPGRKSKGKHKRSSVTTMAQIVVNSAMERPLPVPAELAGSSEGAKWLLAVCKDPERVASLVKPRTFATDAGGGRFISTYAKELDNREVPREALANPRRALADVYAESISRDDSEALREFGNRLLHRTPAWWPKDIEGLKILSRATEMLAEGKQMSHCLGHAGQIYDAKNGVALYGSITAPDGERGTFEIKPNGALLQLFGPGNSPPSPSVKAVYARFVAESKAARARG